MFFRKGVDFILKYCMIIVIGVVLNLPNLYDFLENEIINSKNDTPTAIIKEIDESKQTPLEYKSSENQIANETNDTNVITEEDITYQSPNMNQEEQNMINLINQARIENGFNELDYDPELYKIASIRAEEITQTFSHNRPNGEPFYNISNIIDGENLSRFGAGDAQSSFNGFMSSNDHRSNILHPAFNRIACVRLIYNDQVYWVQAFGY